jgi:nitroimidazol reductase NimA-like FMN-containing flavoprotein (pyridoxamine 5'-phosphate oxidase superfamily)
MTTRPTFYDLPEADTRALLTQHHVGRLAYALGGQVDIEPIGYVFAGDWVYCRTEPGTKLTALGRRPWVALEVDDVAGPFDWRSAVVRGTVYQVSDLPADATSRAETIAALRRAQPEAFTAEDPVPQRSVLLRIHVREVIGRAARSG